MDHQHGTHALSLLSGAVNPIVHGELSWLLGHRLEQRRDRALITIAGLAPDIDGLSLIGGLDAYARYHHLLFHNWLGAAITCAIVARFATQKPRTVFLAALAFHLHLLCDLAGSGPGWPIWYFYPPGRLEWLWSGQWDLTSWQNSTIGLVVTLACLGCALFAGRTPVELFSRRADESIVRALRARFHRQRSKPATDEPSL